MKQVILLLDYAKRHGFTDSVAMRPTAREIFKEVLIDLGDINPSNIIDCSFAGIEMCDVSFADEFVINLQRKVLSTENTVMRIVEAGEFVIENLEGALMLRNAKDGSKICLLSYTHKAYSVIGNLERNLQDTFSFAMSNSEITAREVAAIFGVEINSASNRLKKLYDLRLLQRKEKIDETGRQHVYYLPE